MGSKRLPGKVLLPLNGHTVIGEVLTRCRQITGANQVVCAIPNTKENDPLAEVADEYVSVYRGEEHDVLKRYYYAAMHFKADRIIRITADCPLISPSLCDAVLEKLKSSGFDYASNIDPRTFPRGLDCEAFTSHALAFAMRQGPDEHVTTWMRTSIPRANVYNPWPIEGRLTLDTADDYRTICAYFGHAPYEHLQAA